MPSASSVSRERQLRAGVHLRQVDRHLAPLEVAAAHVAVVLDLVEHLAAGVEKLPLEAEPGGQEQVVVQRIGPRDFRAAEEVVRVVGHDEALQGVAAAARPAARSWRPTRRPGRGGRRGSASTSTRPARGWSRTPCPSTSSSPTNFEGPGGMYPSTFQRFSESISTLPPYRHFVLRYALMRTSCPGLNSWSRGRKNGAVGEVAWSGGRPAPKPDIGCGCADSTM